MKLEIKIVDTSAADEIAKVGKETFCETWNDVNTPEDMAAYTMKSFSPLKMKEEIEDMQNTFLLAREDGKIVGYVKLRRDRPHKHFINEKVLEIERIYVYRKYQDKKAGAALMDCCITIADNEKCHWLWLGVNKGNKKAIDFYKRYGFEIFDEKTFQLGNKIDHDYVMKKKIG